MRATPGQDLKAVHLRHNDIQQQQVELLGGELRERFGAVHGLTDRMPGALGGEAGRRLAKQLGLIPVPIQSCGRLADRFLLNLLEM